MLNLDDFESNEQSLLDALTDSLRHDFPNPDRIGCPDVTVLRGLVSHTLPRADVRRWLPHLSTCSECFQQFESLRWEASRKRRRRSLWSAAIAAVLLVVIVAGWIVLRGGRPTGEPDTEVLDLRNISPVSEAGELEKAPILVLHRSTRHVILKQTRHLEGITIEEIAVFTDAGVNVFDTTARPQAQDQILLIRLDLDVKRFDPGYYRLGVRRPGLTWTEFRLNVR